MNSLIEEYIIADRTMRHNCVRIRGILFIQSLVSSFSFISTFFYLKLIPQIQIISNLYVIWGLIFNIVFLFVLINARQVRKRIIYRVNYLRTIIWQHSIDNYLKITDYKKGKETITNTFLLPQFISSLFFVIIQFICFTKLILL